MFIAQGTGFNRSSVTTVLGNSSGAARHPYSRHKVPTPTEATLPCSRITPVRTDYVQPLRMYVRFVQPPPRQRTMP